MLTHVPNLRVIKTVAKKSYGRGAGTPLVCADDEDDGIPWITPSNLKAAQAADARYC
mgnify:CR=1 FL=1